MPLADNDAVIVTGGASGLGAAVVKELRSCGARPLVLDVAEPDSEVTFFHVDLADTLAAERAVRELASLHGPINAVVCAAGIDACGSLADTPSDEWNRVVQVNLLGNVAVVRAALPDLMRTEGRVVTVASTLGLRALPDATAYCASKFGTVGFTRALAAEVQGRVGVTLLIPGGMATPFFDGRPEQYKPPADAKLNDPGDVARTAVFALNQPQGCEIRELVVCPAVESSWP